MILDHLSQIQQSIKVVEAFDTLLSMKIKKSVHVAKTQFLWKRHGNILYNL